MKFFTFIAYLAGMLLVSLAEMSVLRAYDPSIFSYATLVSLAVLTGMLVISLVASIPKAS